MLVVVIAAAADAAVCSAPPPRQYSYYSYKVLKVTKRFRMRGQLLSSRLYYCSRSIAIEVLVLLLAAGPGPLLAGLVLRRGEWFLGRAGFLTLYGILESGLVVPGWVLGAVPLPAEVAAELFNSESPSAPILTLTLLSSESVSKLRLVPPFEFVPIPFIFVLSVLLLFILFTNLSFASNNTPPLELAS